MQRGGQNHALPPDLAAAWEEEAAVPGCKAATTAGSAWSSSPFCQLKRGGKSRPALQAPVSRVL